MAETENKILMQTDVRNTELYIHTQEVFNFMNSSIVDTGKNAHIFITFFSFAQKHLMLAALSSIRRHRSQTAFNIRQASEAGAWAIFALAHPDEHGKFAKKSKNGVFEASDKLRTKMFNWLSAQYPVGSSSLKGFKERASLQSVHANIIDAWRGVKVTNEGKFSVSFFEVVDEKYYKADLWMTANLGIGILGLVNRAVEDYPLVTLCSDFKEKYSTLERKNEELREKTLKNI